MVIVTDRAKEHLKDALLPQISQPGMTVRLAPTGPDRLGFVADQETEEDQVVEHDGATVLLIKGELADRLGDSVIDYTDTPAGPQLTLRPAHS
jgi:Fe-S cluster assembly iron-binding protein IscA